MDYIQLGVVMLVFLLVFTGIICIWMKIANEIGKKLGIGKLFLNLCKNIDRDNE
ncbi:MAG: hypothetical protein JJT76_09140 [Clostridiaceae bacterium]|nr:hypothetical protein [Clostridiaceae bacterium]